MSLAAISAINPVFGMRINTRQDAFPKGFEATALINAINSISATRHDYDMLLETAQFEEVDSFYNPGIEEVSSDFVLEAIVVDKFSKTDRRMAAVVRVLNKHLAGSEINALEAIVGKPKKTGSYAYVTVQLPFSDGQVVSVIFHAPEGDKKKIGPSDQIIAFRWLLNKRDITQVVAPEDGSEISLESLATRITQLVIKNSARFERTQKEAQAERQELDKAREALAEAEKRQEELIPKLEDINGDIEVKQKYISVNTAKLEKQKAINRELEERLNALRKTVPVNNQPASIKLKGLQKEFDDIKSTFPGYIPDYHDKEYAKIENLFQQAVDLGKNPMTITQYLDAVERNEEKGVPIRFFKEQLSEKNSNLQAAKRGKKDVLRRYGGSNADKKFAIDNLKKSVAETEWIIAHNGLGDSENRIRYQQYLERILNEGAASGTEAAKNDPFGQAYPEFTGKPVQAIEHLLKVKSGYVPGAFHKEGLGQIDLVWGNSSYGLQHIIERRNTQGVNGIEFARKIPQIIQSGRVEDDSNANSKLIISDTDKAVIKLEWHNEKRTWLLTAYPLYESIPGSVGTLSAKQTSGNGQSSSTTPGIENNQGSGWTTDLNQTNEDGKTPPSNQDLANTIGPNLTFVNDLNDIITGKYGLDSDKIIELFEKALDEAEKLPNYKDFEPLLEQASNHLTEVLNKKAGK